MDSFRMAPNDFMPKGMYSVTPGVAVSGEVPLGGGMLRIGAQGQHRMSNVPGMRNRTDFGGGADYSRSFDSQDILADAVSLYERMRR
jgi:hypothetical protein